MTQFENTALTGLLTIIGAYMMRLVERRSDRAKIEKLQAETDLIKAETGAKDIQNQKSAVEMWQHLAGELERKVELLNTQVNSLMEQNKALMLKLGHMESELAKAKQTRIF